MNAQERYIKTEEVLSKFKNGKELYHKSATFNIVVQQLVSGVDIYELLESVIQINSDTQNAFEQYMHRSTPYLTDILNKY